MSGPPIAQDPNRLVVFGSQLIGVVIVIVGLLTQQGELHSVRPSGRAKMPALPKTDAETDTFARLWDDPLQDVLSVGQPTEEANAQNPSRESPTSPSPTPAPEHANYIFLWNILDAALWPDAKERRLRIRYAVVSAILAEGYRPLRVARLHSLQTSPGRFETFRTQDEKKKYKYVCVIWTPKQSTEFPIDQEELRAIKTEIGKQDRVMAEGNVRFLHHGTSQDLYNYLTAPSAMTEASPRPSILFMRATIPLTNPNLGISSLPAERPFVQEVTTDDKLVESLFRELCLRIPALNDKSKAPRVVVFTESDTIYSKAIVHELEKQLETDPKSDVDVYTYLQALDGSSEEARAPASPNSSKPSDIATSLLQGRAISETSFGTSQFDYLRRAALALKATRNQNVVAVGILGSDIYDKMLVLQAVRPVLPAAVFFTTDLDALYLERSMEPFTRNLVVASADGLDADESSNGVYDRWKLPPMRDSYQTVLVKQVRNILRGDASEKSGSAHIFEIGAGRPIDLTTAGGTSWPLWWLAQGWFNPFIFILALGNAILILWAVTTRDEENRALGAMKKWAKWLVYGEMMLAAICMIVLLSILILWNPIVGKLDSDFGLKLSYLDRLFDEPLTLGVSIWPSIMIRLLAFGVAILLLSLASHSFVVHGLTQKEVLRKALGGTIQFKDPSKKDGEGVGFEQFFQQLFEWKHVRWRIVIFSIVYLSVSFFLFMIWPPTVPGRGGSALLIEKIVLALGVALYIVHLTFCLVLHWHALRLLYGIGSHFERDHESARARPACAQHDSISLEQILTSLGTLTTVIGKTLLYPLTVLILIILSRLRIFDNWVMTPSLTITFALGAIVLVAASLILWLEGARLKRLVMAQRKGPAKLKLEAVSDGVFAAWYSQPIFSAILSALAVFGSLSIAGPLTRLFSDSF